MDNAACSTQPINSVQSTMILEYLQNHSLLASGKLIGNNGVVMQDDMWTALADSISLHGPKKSGEQVKAFWKRLQVNAKKYKADKLSHYRKTGNDVDLNNTFKLDNQKELTLKIIGDCHKNGLQFSRELGLKGTKPLLDLSNISSVTQNAPSTLHLESSSLVRSAKKPRAQVSKLSKLPVLKIHSYQSTLRPRSSSFGESIAIEPEVESLQNWQFTNSSSLNSHQGTLHYSQSSSDEDSTAKQPLAKVHKNWQITNSSSSSCDQSALQYSQSNSEKDSIVEPPLIPLIPSNTNLQLTNASTFSNSQRISHTPLLPVDHNSRCQFRITQRKISSTITSKENQTSKTQHSMASCLESTHAKQLSNRESLTKMQFASDQGAKGSNSDVRKQRDVHMSASLEKSMEYSRWATSWAKNKSFQEEALRALNENTKAIENNTKSMNYLSDLFQKQK